MDIRGFLDYLEKEKKSSENTLMAYKRDIMAFEKYLSQHGVTIEKASETDVIGYLMDINKAGKSKATGNRKLASIRAAFDYLMKEGKVSKDPTRGIKTSRATRK